MITVVIEIIYKCTRECVRYQWRSSGRRDDAYRMELLRFPKKHFALKMYVSIVLRNVAARE